MSSLDSALRGQLETRIVRARDLAEAAARVALDALATNGEPHPSMTEEDRNLRRLLRAKMRQAGGYDRLVEACAYEQWHRMLFARFLAENGLLIYAGGAPVTLEDCAELAAEEGEPDAWVVAARIAAEMLPGIFRPEDPLLRVRLAPEGRLALEGTLAELPPVVFQADDALGWCYQFWQTKRKKEINASERKIGGAELPAVTQLFTEPYMVRFLLQNSLGAWWASRHPDSPLAKKWEYLVRNEDGSPAAGPFHEWPEKAADLRVMDPCCGSGHFLVAVEAFDMLREMRMEEEGPNDADAGDAVLRDNLFGLEIDPRCVQIAAFALALSAWTSGGYRLLPLPHLACSGLPLSGKVDEWAALAKGDRNLDMALRRLHHLFADAPELGSLIRPRDEADEYGLFKVEWDNVAEALEDATKKEVADPVAAVFGGMASGVARAASILAGQYHVVVTNVPYLTRGKHNETLKRHLEAHYNAAKADLATAFVERCRDFCFSGGSCALVTPQNWLFLTSYKRLREKLLAEETWNFIVRLGPHAFETIGGEVVNIALLIMTHSTPKIKEPFCCIDATLLNTPNEKANYLRETVYNINQLLHIIQTNQLMNPDSRIIFELRKTTKLLLNYAKGVHGLGTKDSPRFIRFFWEVISPGDDWEFIQSTTEETMFWGGMERIIFWEKGNGILQELGKEGWAVLAGGMAWGKEGVSITQMSSLPAALYNGSIFDKNVAIISPHDPIYLPAIWAFCSSHEYAESVRQIDQKLNVTNSTLVKVPFDLERWQKVADEMGPLPEPHSDDPTQWLFKGNVVGVVSPSGCPVSAPLHVAVARLLGYRWPEQDAPDALADADGIVCIPSVTGERPGAERLRDLLVAAYGPEWSSAVLDRLLADEGFGGKDLETWLRDGFFASHCRLFHNRPFLWQVWDGRRDGFSAIINYHGLDRAKLEKLTYSYLGDWISRQRSDAGSGVAGAEGRLVAAQQLQAKLQAILEGEPPFDIHVRWKKTHEQPIGWEPDLNDGVRMNIRPFVAAGILRSRFTINWNKDRGKNPDGSERINDLHFTRKEKEAARLAHRPPETGETKA